jgi:hypothetical protein
VEDILPPAIRLLLELIFQYIMFKERQKNSKDSCPALHRWSQFIQKRLRTSRVSSLIIPQKPQTPQPKLPSLSLVPKPLKAVLEPFSSIMNRPFEGFMKRIRSILGRRPMPEPPSSPATTTTTTSRPKTTTSRLSQEQLLGISVPTAAPVPLLPYRMAKYSRLVQHQTAPPYIKLSTEKPPADYDLIDTNPRRLTVTHLSRT